MGLALIMLLNFGEAAVTLMVPWFGANFGASLIAGSLAEQGALLTLAIIFGLLVVQSLVRLGGGYLNAVVSESILADLRTRIFDHVQRLPLAYHHGRRRGDIIALLTQESARLSDFVSRTLVGLPAQILTAAGASLLILTIDPVLAILVPLLIVVFYLTMRVLGRRFRQLGQEIQAADAEAIALAEENLDLLPAIKSFTIESVESRRYRTQIELQKTLQLRLTRLNNFLGPMINLTVSASVLALLFFAGRKLDAGTMTSTELLRFLLYVAVLVRPVSDLSFIYGQIQTARGTLARIASTLAAEVEAVDPPQGAAPRIRGDIVFDNVTFAYPERTPAVHGLNFAVRAGQAIAITGENGAGKSTAVALLMGFYRPEGGRILLDGQDIAEMPLARLRAAIGYVPQTRHLRNGSVWDNIVFGNANATKSQVEAAARIAQAHEFVCNLPNGYDTQIGDKGVRLSGGQRQRIALARALLKDPPILILDEATSMYDLEGEAAFIAGSREALAGRTVILITHRPASLALASRTFHMADGKIGETASG